MSTVELRPRTLTDGLGPEGLTDDLADANDRLTPVDINVQ
jgi:hypothetical protein